MKSHFVSLCLLLATLMACPAVRANTAVEAAPKDDKWIQRHAELVEVIQKGNANVVFLGDSITEHWNTESPQGGQAVWRKHFAPLKAVNLGISGDRTQNVLWRINHGALDGLKPKVVVLMIGTNNTGMERDRPVPRNSTSETVEGVKAVTRAVTTKLPDTKVLVLGLFPRGERPDEPQRLQVCEINAQLTDLHDGKQVYFWDIGSLFLSPDGTLSSSVMPDYLHLNEAGYRIWADAINQPLEALLAGKTLRAGYPLAPTVAVQTVRL